jgi:hypothetical protein
MRAPFLPPFPKWDTNPAHVYHIYDLSDHLLYVGMTTMKPEHRIAGHERYSQWFPDEATYTVEPFPCTWGARIGEANAISKEHPRFNRNMYESFGAAGYTDQELRALMFGKGGSRERCTHDHTLDSPYPLECTCESDPPNAITFHNTNGRFRHWMTWYRYWTGHMPSWEEQKAAACGRNGYPLHQKGECPQCRPGAPPECDPEPRDTAPPTRRRTGV